MVRSAATAAGVFTNSLYGPIDRQFYHRGFEGWMVKLNVDPDGGSGSMRTSSSNGRRDTGRIRSGSRAAIARPIPIAIRDRCSAGQDIFGMNTVSSALWPWIALAGLGAFHGLNPAMGWLFAVALGLHRRSRAARRSRPGADRARPCRSGGRRLLAVILFGTVLDATLLGRGARGIPEPARLDMPSPAIACLFASG